MLLCQQNRKHPPEAEGGSSKHSQVSCQGFRWRPQPGRRPGPAAQARRVLPDGVGSSQVLSLWSSDWRGGHRPFLCPRQLQGALPRAQGLARGPQEAGPALGSEGQGGRGRGYHSRWERICRTGVPSRQPGPQGLHGQGKARRDTRPSTGDAGGRRHCSPLQCAAREGSSKVPSTPRPGHMWGCDRAGQEKAPRHRLQAPGQDGGRTTGGLPRTAC